MASRVAAALRVRAEGPGSGSGGFGCDVMSTSVDYSLKSTPVDMVDRRRREGAWRGRVLPRAYGWVEAPTPGGGNRRVRPGPEKMAGEDHEYQWRAAEPGGGVGGPALERRAHPHGMKWTYVTRRVMPGVSTLVGP